jgi:chromosome partitioning protein
MIVSFASIKGGVGKTTSCVNLAAALAQKKYHILIVDFDAQGGSTHHLSSKFNGKFHACLSEVLLGNKSIQDAIHTYNQNIDLIPVSYKFSKISNTDFSDKLVPFITVLRDKYDFIFFDLSPAIFPGAIIPLSYSDYAVIPVYVQGGLSLLGLEAQGRIIAELQEQQRKVDVLGIVATFVDSTRMSKDVMAFLGQQCKEELFASTIRKNTSLSQASSLGKTIFDYKPKSYGAKDYSNLANEFLKRIQKKKEGK